MERAGIKIEKYYASEIDEYSMSIARYNFPNTIYLGDVTKITQQKINELSTIDLLIGGSPCQSLSSSNVWLKDGEYGINGTGASRLFWEYVKILKILKLKNTNIKFLLENVGSANVTDRAIIDKTLGVTGIKFNSSLLSAQNRNRIYWTNIYFELPHSRKEIYMQNILEQRTENKYFLSQKMHDYIMCLGTGNWKNKDTEIDLDIARPLTATMHKMHRAGTDNYVSCDKYPKDKTNVRRLTPIECERLQTLPDDYTKIGLVGGKEKTISDTKRYMAIGNGWTVDVVAHIFSFLNQ